MAVCDIYQGPSIKVGQLPDKTPPLEMPSPVELNIDTILGQRCFNQRRRRAEILCNTRVLLSQMPHASLTICEVAARSNVSIQTVYNLIGNRVDVLGDAVVDYLASVGRYSIQLNDYPNPVLALTDAYFEMACRHPEYTRNVVLTYFPPDRVLYERIQRQGVANLRECFRIMSAHGALKTGEIDFKTLSARIAAMHGIMMLDGLTTLSDMSNLRMQLHESTLAILLQAVKPTHAAVMEDWISRGRYRFPTIAGPRLSLAS